MTRLVSETCGVSPLEIRVCRGPVHLHAVHEDVPRDEIHVVIRGDVRCQRGSDPSELLVDAAGPLRMSTVHDPHDVGEGYVQTPRRVGQVVNLEDWRLD